MRHRISWTALASAFVAAAGIAACTSTQTSTGVAAPSDQKCQIQVSNTPSNFTDTGGAGSLSIATTRDCSWSITSNASWVALPSSSTSGQGDASISYTVAANAIPQARTAALAVEGQTVQLTQAAAPCRYSLNKAADVAPYGGGALSITLTTLTGCAWGVSSDSTWLAPQTSGGNATAVVTFTIGANSGPLRVGHAVIGGQTYTVTQDASPAPPAPSPSPSPAPSPTPSPTPSPSPTPTPGPTQVSVSGKVSNLTGRCPAISFTIGSDVVTADSSTVYSGGHCSDVKNGVTVDVDGLRQTSGVITATSIHKR